MFYIIIFLRIFSLLCLNLINTCMYYFMQLYFIERCREIIHLKKRTTVFSSVFSEGSPLLLNEWINFCYFCVSDESKVITSAHLRFTDLHSQDEDIVYTMLLEPHLGSLVLMESSGVTQVLNKTNKFTQADIVQGFISYTSLVEIGPTAAEDQVTFNVTDLQSNVLSNQVE